MDSPKTLKQFHAAWIRSVAKEYGLPMSGVRDAYPNPNHSYKHWWETLVSFVRAGNTLPRRLLNSPEFVGHPYNYSKLCLDCHPFRPFPEGYVIPKAD